MDEMRYSLGLTYPLKNDPDRVAFFRAADYDMYSDELIQINVFEEQFGTETKIIGSRPNEAKLNMASLRQWKYESSDSTRTISFDFEKNIFEVVFLSELENIEYSDSEKIRMTLHTGFYLDKNVSQNLLFVIGKTSSHYAVIHCPKSKLRFNGEKYCIPRDISDMLHALHCLDEFDIRISEVISTEDVNIHLSDGSRAATRYFYKHTKLPDSIGSFKLYNLNEYIPQYVSKYLKKSKDLSSLNKNDIRKIVDVIKASLLDEEFANDFFENTGYKWTELKTRLVEFDHKLESTFSREDSMDAIICDFLLGFDDIKSNCYNVAREKWLSEAEEQRATVKNELEEMKEEIGQLEKEIAKKKQTAENYAISIQELEEQEKSLSSDLMKIQNDIENELSMFTDNVVHNTAICAIASKFNAIGNSTSTKYLMCQDNYKYSPTEIVIEDIGDYEEYLSDNLIECGYNEHRAVEMAGLISFAVNNSMPIIVKNHGVFVARSIAAMYGENNAYIININQINYDFAALRTEICETKTHAQKLVLYINGAFDTINSRVFNDICTLMLCGQANIIPIFTLEGIDIEILPSDIWDKGVYLDCVSAISYKGKNIISSYKTLDDIAEDYSQEEVTAKMKLLRPYKEILSNFAAIHYAKYMVDINSDIKSDWLLLLQLYVQAISKEKAEFVIEEFEKAGVDSKIINVIKQYC